MFERIIDLLPSQDLKNKISETNHKFKLRELLQIVQDYGCTFSEKQELWSYILENSDKDKNLIKSYVYYQNSLLKRFKEDGKFLVHISGYNYADYKEYTLNSFNECMSAINYFLDEHIERPPSTIAIRKFHDENTEIGIFDGKYQLVCQLNSCGQIVKIFDYTHAGVDCSLSCIDCDFDCVHAFYRVKYPSFVNENEVVKYYDNGKYQYGICIIYPNTFCSDYDILPISSPVLKERLYDMDGEAYISVPAPLVEKMDFDELSDKEKEDYYAYMKYLYSDEEK